MNDSRNYIKYRTLCNLSEFELEKIELELNNVQKQLESKPKEQIRPEKELLEEQLRSLNQKLQSFDVENTKGNSIDTSKIPTDKDSSSSVEQTEIVPKTQTKKENK